MDRTTGAVTVLASALVIAAVAFGLRTRMPAAAVAVVLALGGAGLGIGGALVEGETGAEQALAATLILAVLTPLHVRVVLGPLGRRR